jgi:hypothetical protein
MIILLGRDLYMHTNRVKLSTQQLFITIKRKGVLKLHSYKSESHLSKDYPCQAWFHFFKKHGHMIPLWKGKNPIYFGVIRSKVKVTITINGIFDNRVIST